MKLQRLKQRNRCDSMLLCIVGVLVAIGLAFVYSASCYTSQKDFGTPFYYVLKQAIGATVGLVGCLIFEKVDLEKLKKWSFPALCLAIVLLILVFIPGIGIRIYGANRWIGFGSFSFQPSEFAKFAFVLFAAAYLSKHFEATARKRLLPVALAGGAICFLILLEPNMSITMCLMAVMVIMLFIGGMKLKYFAILAFPAAAFIVLLILIEPYRLNRLLAFLDPWASPKDEGYQLIQSFYALGSGGWFGLGFLNSRQKFEFLPFAESDFIFSVIGEEIGFVGACGVLLLFVLLIYRGVKIALAAQDRFQCFLATGIVSVIAVQTVLNVAVVTGSIPPTGLPLPFISYGGSSLTVFLSSVGVLLNISRRSEVKHTLISN